MFPNLIKSKRGKYGGTWATLPILLKIANNADKAIEAVVYKTFIEGKILIHRDSGGDEFNKLNSLIDSLPDRIERANQKKLPPCKANKGVYINIAKLVNEKVKGEFLKNWNKEHDDSIVQKKREELLKFLSSAIEYKLITSYDQLKAMIDSYKL
jgi:hypothetical protein